MFLLRKSMLCAMLSFVFLPLFSSINVNKVSAKSGAEQRVQPPKTFWKPGDVALLSTGFGIGSYIVIGSVLPAAAIGGGLFKLTEHYSRRGLAKAGQELIAQCDREMLLIAQSASKNEAVFMKNIKRKYGLPHGLVKVHAQLKLDQKRLETAAQNFELCYSVMPENLLPDQIKSLKAKQQQAQALLASTKAALALLEKKPLGSKL